MLKNEIAPKVLPILKIASLVLITALSTVFFAYHLAYAKKVIPGVKIWRIDLGNKDPEQVETILSAKFAKRQEQTLLLASGGKTFELKPKDVGISYDVKETVHAALKIGRRGSIGPDLKTEINTWFKGVEMEPVLKVEADKLASALTLISDEIDDPSGDARFEAKEGNLEIIREKNGRVIEKEKLEDELISLMKEAFGNEINIPVVDVSPQLTSGDLESLKSQVEELILNPPTLTYQQRTFQPSAEEALSLMKLTKMDLNAQIEPDEKALKEYIAGIARKIDREPTGDIFKLDGERVVEFRLAASGLRLDQEQTRALLSGAILKPGEEIELPVGVSNPERADNDYGIRELLGEGVSNFAGSAQGRINNIVTASGRLKGILIAPGETFSFNDSLGEVSAATGFDQAYIISEGRTILGTGGGVCQVSTTVFRAAFNSGLEIVKRTAHAYRVSYYEPPIGFDATVYAPSPDLVFKNDTGNYILIWSAVDLANQNLYFRIYGTSDGRWTKMTGPVVSNETPPPAPLYQDDSTLPKGTTRQIDFAAWGANATLKREVYRNGDILHNDTFYSHFQPWQAVYLVGTGG